MSSLHQQTQARARTSVRAFTTRDRGSEKSPYLTVNLALTPLSVKSCTASGCVSADATKRTKSSGPFFWILREVCHIDQITRVGKQVGGVPGVQYINLDLLSNSLDCGDFIVRDRISGIIIADLSDIALADE